MATPARTSRTFVSALASRIARRAAVAGTGVALIVGMAAPAFADSGTAAPASPAAKASSKIVPTASQLMPHGKPRHQAYLRLSGTQKANAAAIVKAARELKLPARAAVIAVATAMQESTLHNYRNLGNRNDHDSLGLFQQRPSAGWGTPAQTEQPDHAAKSFLHRLVKVHNWQKLPLTRAAQDVQVSAYGDRYAKWESEAAGLVAADLKPGR